MGMSGSRLLRLFEKNGITVYSVIVTRRDGLMLIFFSYWTVILDAIQTCKANEVTCLGSPKGAKVSFFV